MSADLHILRASRPASIPTTLRRIADEVEAGTYGPSSSCAVVLDSRRLRVFYAGEGESAPNAVMLLVAGANKVTGAGR